MIRKVAAGGNVVAPTAVSNGNQENPILRSKTVDMGTGNAAAARPPMRFALGEIKNNQQQPVMKRTVSLKTTKTEETAAVVPKVEPRRPLRSTTLSNTSLPTTRAVEPKPVRAVASKTTTSNASATSSVLSSTNNSTLSTSGVSVVGAKPKASAIAPSKIGAVAAKPRLLRSNAVSSLHAAAASAEEDGLMTDASDLVAMQAALCLAPVKEESEDALAQSPNRENAYSSSMMPNIDKADEGNPQFVAEYVNDIYNYLRALEMQQPIKENFLDGKEVSGRMRSILVDWLSQVHVRFHLLPETMYMTVAMIDRFLQDVMVPKEKLQLVGVTAMFIASKYEEMYAPEIGDFVYITDNSCTKQDIRVMECLLLRSLGFALGRPLPIHFLRRYSKIVDADAPLHTLAKYFLELALIQYPMAHFPPSIMAAAALWLAMKLLNPAAEWSQTLIFYSKYRESDFMTCFRRLCRVVLRTQTQEIKQQAVRNKFSTSKFMEISKHPCLDLATIRKYGEI